MNSHKSTNSVRISYRPFTLYWSNKMKMIFFYSTRVLEWRCSGANSLSKRNLQYFGIFYLQYWSRNIELSTQLHFTINSQLLLFYKLIDRKLPNQIIRRLYQVEQLSLCEFIQRNQWGIWEMINKRDKWSLLSVWLHLIRRFLALHFNSSRTLSPSFEA